jgi:hypothetical protein
MKIQTKKKTTLQIIRWTICKAVVTIITSLHCFLHNRHYPTGTSTRLSLTNTVQVDGPICITKFLYTSVTLWESSEADSKHLKKSAALRVYSALFDAKVRCMLATRRKVYSFFLPDHTLACFQEQCTSDGRQQNLAVSSIYLHKSWNVTSSLHV